jgi:putative ABC transport system ATP-binding protein
VALLETRDLKKVYRLGAQEVEALRGVSLDVERGEMVCLMGPSGSGKSTLLHLIGGLDRPSTGSVRLAGTLLGDYSDAALSRFRRTRLGFVFQFFNLLPTLSALENVALPLLLEGKPISEVEKPALALLDRLELRARAEHRPHELSGGEMQRVAIARALIASPLLVLADEPTGNLDSKSGATVLQMLKELVRERGQTLLMVTHDQHAASFGDRLLTLRDGLIESDHPTRTAHATASRG